jgi:hypothetical protein
VSQGKGCVTIIYGDVCLGGEKKNCLRWFTPNIGQTESVSDCGSVCLTEAKSEDKPRTIPIIYVVFIMKRSSES